MRDANDNAAPLIAISGGIGAGKTVVSRVLSAMGYDVYDCDSRAKEIMDNDAGIKCRLAADIGAECVTIDGDIDRKALAAAVFGNNEKLTTLNAIVHGAVLEDLRRWHEEHTRLCFVETAILYQSGIDRMVDEVWMVTAPEQVRVERVMQRSGLTSEQVRQRIQAQAISVERRHSAEYMIINDEEHSVLLQINALLARYNICQPN